MISSINPYSIPNITNRKPVLSQKTSPMRGEHPFVPSSAGDTVSFKGKRDPSVVKLAEPSKVFCKNCRDLGVDPDSVIDYDWLSSVDSCAEYLNKFVCPNIEREKIGSLCDLGCSYARPTYLMKQVFNIPDSKCMMVDDYFPDIIDPMLEAHFTGLHMLDYLESGEEKFDMISACMLGPIEEICNNCFDYISPARLLNALPKRLNDSGYFFTYSDKHTISLLTEECDKRGIKYLSHSLPYDSKTVFPYYTHDTKGILIKKEDLVKNQVKFQSDPSAAGKSPSFRRKTSSIQGDTVSFKGKRDFFIIDHSEPRKDFAKIAATSVLTPILSLITAGFQVWIHAPSI